MNTRISIPRLLLRLALFPFICIPLDFEVLLRLLHPPVAFLVVLVIGVAVRGATVVVGVVEEAALVGVVGAVHTVVIGVVIRVAGVACASGGSVVVVVTAVASPVVVRVVYEDVWSVVVVVAATTAVV